MNRLYSVDRSLYLGDCTHYRTTTTMDLSILMERILGTDTPPAKKTVASS